MKIITEGGPAEQRLSEMKPGVYLVRYDWDSENDEMTAVWCPTADSILYLNSENVTYDDSSTAGDLLVVKRFEEIRLK